MHKLNIPPVYFFASVIVIVVLFFIIPTYNIIPFPYNLSGIVLMLFAFLMTGKAKGLLNSHNTPSTFEPSTTLVEEGIYKRSRNPMYLGMFIFLLGFAVCFGNLLAAIIPFIFASLVQIQFIRFEEKRLEEFFGDEYRAYKSRVRRWL